MHAAYVFFLLFYFHGLNVRAFILIFNFIDLILKELVIISFFVVDDACDEKQSFKDNALYGWVEWTGFVTVRSDNVANAKEDQSESRCGEVSYCEEVEGFKNECCVEFSEEDSES